MSSKGDSPEEKGGKPPLFRQQAVEHQVRRLDGEVMLPLSMRLRVLILLGALVIGGAGTFLATASYARMETVVGWIVPQEGLIRVTARQGGIVEDLHAAEGDHVAAGAALATLRLSSDIDDGNAATALAAHLAAQIEASRAEAVARREKLVAEQDQLRAQREALLREREEGDKRLRAMAERLALIEGNLERVETIAARGFASTRSVEEADMMRLVAEQDMAEARRMMLSLDRQIGDLDARLQSLPLDIAAADAQSRANDAILAQRETELSVQSRYRAGATVQGRVVALPVAVGQSVGPEAVLAVLTPAGSRLEAELYVPSRAAGFIRAGQDVRLMYQAFPYQKFGTATGTVRSVSHTVLAPGEVAIPGTEIREPVFRVKVELQREAVRAYGQEILLQPGMLLTASIILDRRTLFEWLLDPLYAVGRMG